MKKTTKKLFAVMCMLALIVALTPSEILAFPFGKNKTEKKEETEELSLSDILSYEMTSIEWNNKLKKFVVEGYLYNCSDEYDLLDFNDIEIMIADANDLEMCTIKLNTKVQDALMLPPQCIWIYNMTFKNLVYDVDEYELSYGIHAYVFGECSYTECAGVGCPVCGKTEKDVTADKNTENKSSKNSSSSTGNTDDELMYLCPWCKGGGLCKECGGSGKNDATSVVLKSMGCQLCDKTGKCVKCGGEGMIPY